MEDRRRRRTDAAVSRHWSFILASGLGIAVLCALGVWQLQRLAWKESLIAEIASRAALRLSPLPLLAADDAAATSISESRLRRLCARRNQIHQTSMPGRAGRW
jgi:cytochrome oxidase assembly protein ShyY1